ncbi:ATP-binding protein [Dongia sp.]|uniref:ATP-binding protein n=1 Tax=Dongia sp. TaxID=1977262 RepID=UPI0035AE5C4B
MKQTELEELYRDAETDRVERKESLADDDRIRQAICAFANDLPNHGREGVVIVGQRDNLSCAGLKIDDRLLLRLSNYRSEGKILPIPTLSVSKATVDGCEVALVVVQPSDNPPVKLDGRTWIRVGPRRAIATAEEERRLTEKRRWGNLPFDSHGVPGATLGDIDLRAFKNEYLPSAIAADVLATDQRPEIEQLRALRLLDAQGIPTVTALLVLGINPMAWIPCAYVQFLKIDGTQLTDPIRNQKSLTGTVGEQIRALDDIIRANVEQKVVVGGEKRIDSWNYPEAALRQIFRNAILHRAYEGTNAPTRITWYRDRIEVQSPGGPYGQVTKENFGRPGITDYRNPTLAEALRNLNYVERFGVGIPIAREALEKNGNPPPDYQIEDQHVHVTVRQAQ